MAYCYGFVIPDIYAEQNTKVRNIMILPIVFRTHNVIDGSVTDSVPIISHHSCQNILYNDNNNDIITIA